MNGLGAMLLAMALALAAPAFALLALTLAARSAPPAQAVAARRRIPRVAVLVPAHNESVHLLPTIACLRKQLGRHDRLLVVADNCTDDTAAQARAAGAEVVERRAPTLRGKGYALAYGVDALRADPPEVLLVVDADCVLSAGSVRGVAAECASAGRPVQMLNLMHAAPGAGLRHRMLAFAMVMKNRVRPLGSQRLGGACQLMGTGMALPWALAADAPWATGHVAEDMQLGLRLAAAGYAPRFSLVGEVKSQFPADTGTARVQKTRWEHGHLAVLAQQWPPLAVLAARSRRRDLAVLALDLMIPPLALYSLVLVALMALIGAVSLWWSPLRPAAGLLGVGVAALTLAVAVGWWQHGRHLLRLRELLAAPAYALWKLPVYAAYLLNRRSGWVRTQRGP